jgi:UMF1 family MFS transporter
MTFGGIYAASVFGWGAFELGLFGIVLTIAGAVGCLVGGWADDRFGSRAVIACAIVVLLIGAAGVLSVDSSRVFYVLDAIPRAPGAAPFASSGEQVYLAFTILIGLSVGPVQSASRSMLARLAPREKMTEFFGLFAFSGKATAFAAPLLIAAVTAASGSQRLGISMAALFLVAGLILLVAKVPNVAVSGGNGASR